MSQSDTQKSVQLPLEGSTETVRLTEIQFRACLQSLANQTGSMAELARRLDISGQFIGDVIAGRKRPGPKLLDKFQAKSVRMIELPLVTMEIPTEKDNP